MDTATVARRRFGRVAVAVLVLALALVPSARDAELACAHDLTGVCVDPDAPLGEGDLVDKGNFPFEHVSVAADRSPPASSGNVRVLGHADPGTGFNADVVAHDGFAYMGSWGNLETQDCP